jgi:hypothetical protein
MVRLKVSASFFDEAKEKKKEALPLSASYQTIKIKIH